MRKTAIYRRIFARIFAVILLIFQGILLDYYLIVNEKSSWWFAWISTDAIVLLAWIFTMYVSHRKLTQNKDDEIKFAFVAWIVYSVHLVPQIATLFKLKTRVFDDENLAFGGNTLKMNLCLTPMLFLFLIYAHHDAKSHSRRKYYLEKMTAAVTLDLFDSVEMLEYLFDRGSLSTDIQTAILVFSCMNIFLPTFALYELKYNKFHDSGEVSAISFRFIYIFSFMFFVNVPFFVLRMILWHQYHLDISVLLAKNALAITLGVLEIFEFFGDQRPRRCESCAKTFAKDFFKGHRKTCLTDGNPKLIACQPAIRSEEEKLVTNSPESAGDLDMGNISLMTKTSKESWV